METYSFLDAFEKAGENDRLVLYNEIDFVKREAAQYVISTSQALSRMWQIIPAKKEPVSAEEWFQREYPPIPGTSVNDCSSDFGMDYMIDAFKAGEQNRDLLYADLVEMIEKAEYLHSDGLEEIHATIKRIRSAISN